MSEDFTGRYLILSDLHFGTEESSLNHEQVINGLAEYMARNGSWKEVIFSGDLLDLNLSTFTISIEGNKDKGILGFREFMKKLYSIKAPNLKVENWIYIPGNHDYKIWDMLATKIVCEDVLASGQPMGTVQIPYKQGSWPNGIAFIAGVFPPNIVNTVCVEYPDHIIKYSNGFIVVTHGHYIDHKQTQFKSLETLIKKTGSEKAAGRQMFIETAQYQAVANAVSYTEKTRKLVNLLLGEGNIRAFLRKVLSRYLVSIYFPISPLRGQSIDEDQLTAIEFYLKYFREYIDFPDYFIFGHTHSQGERSTADIKKNKRICQQKDIKVFNVGAFMARRDKAGTFIRVDIINNNPPKVILLNINNKCIVGES